VRPLLAAAAVVGALAAACLQPQTEFHGSAFFPGGVKNCRAVCARDGLEMASYIYTGRFATSCVCRPPTPAPAPPAAPASQPTSSRDDAADVAAALARIESQRRRDPRLPSGEAPGSE